jgi:hypothetical protein
MINEVYSINRHNSDLFATGEVAVGLPPYSEAIVGDKRDIKGE